MKPGVNLIVKLRDDKKSVAVLPPHYKSDNLELVTKMLDAVLLGSGATFSCQEVCQAAKNLGDINASKELYALVVEKFKCRAEATLRDVAVRAKGDDGLTLEALVAEWLTYRQDAAHVALVLMWLDSRYVLQQTTDRSIFSMAVRVLHDVSKVSHELLVPKALDGCVEAINRERKGDIVTRAHLSSFRELVSLFGVYFSLVEPVLLRATHEYYSNLVTTMVLEEKCSAEEFFATVQRIQTSERERCVAFLDSRSRGKFDECLQKALLAEHGVQVLSGGFKALASNSAKRAEVRLAAKLLSQKYVGRSEAVRMIFRQFVVDSGTEIVSSREHDDTLIKSLLAMKDSVLDLVKSSFDDAEPFRLAMREAFETFIRVRQNKVAELLAKHLDGLLRLGQKEVAEPDMDNAIERAMKLFNFVPAKDIFEAFYWKDLCRRLVFQRCASFDLERRVIARLKVISGTNVTMKLEGMLKDITASEEISARFAEFWEQQQRLGINGVAGGVSSLDTLHPLGLDAASGSCLESTASMGDSMPSWEREPTNPMLDPSKGDGETAVPIGASRTVARASSSAPSTSIIEPRVMVLTRGYWPTYEIPDLTLAPEVQCVAQAFASFYSAKFSGRRLAWLHLLSTCTVKAIFPRGKKELQMSLLQALVLNLFNVPSGQETKPATTTGSSPAAPVLSIADISRELNIAADNALQQQELFCAVASLSFGSQAVIRRQVPSQEKLTAADVLVFNEAFYHKLSKIRILPVQPKESVQEESAATNERVFSERHYVVDAAIVRLMKSRKRMPHAELVVEVPAMLKFPVAVTDLKKRIETLIDRDFIQRSPQDNTIYEYRA
jgi:hypothetical protein